MDTTALPGGDSIMGILRGTEGDTDQTINLSYITWSLNPAQARGHRLLIDPSIGMQRSNGQVNMWLL